MFYFISVCHRKDGRCRGHKIGFGLCGDGKSKYSSNYWLLWKHNKASDAMRSQKYEFKSYFTIESNKSVETGDTHFLYKKLLLLLLYICYLF